MIVVLSGLGRVPKWKEYDRVFNPGPVGLLPAHLALAECAVSEQWDESVLVVQDDIKTFLIGEHHGDITSYWPSFTGQWGWMRYRDHVCPKAFTATAAGWARLVESWSKAGQTCELWKPDYVTVGGEGVKPGRKLGN